MKCIQNIKTKTITRVSETDAQKAVIAGEATYTTKGAWKSAGRP